jgi:hypothetical protein
MKREAGYYWVKQVGEWLIGHYEGTWTLCGRQDYPFTDEDLDEIDERKIERNAE